MDIRHKPRSSFQTNMLLIVYGTRPEWIKINPIIKLMDVKKIPYIILFTGQHTTLINEKYDRKITINNGINRLDSIFNSILNDDSIFVDIDRVMVQGDTATAFAIAMAAFHRKIQVIHLEAGLRSYDNNNPYPEELYRRCISNIATIHFCPTEANRRNLNEEQIRGDIHVVGNTSIDAILPYKDKSKNGGGCLITLHRRENQPIMKEWLIELNLLAIDNEIPFTFISHPNFDISLKKYIEHINIISSVSHDTMINMILNADVLISDSGGIQEEAAFFHKPLIVCRKVTERPEAIGSTSFICSIPSQLASIFNLAKSANTNLLNLPCPFGDGNTAEKIINILCQS